MNDQSQHKKVSIPTRDAILRHLRARRQPLALPQLAHELKLQGEAERDALQRRLNAMCRDGQLLRNRKKAYGIASKMNLIAGRIIAKADGFGFLRPEEGEDIYISPREMRRVLHGDRVMVSLKGRDHRDRPEGLIAEILERGHSSIVGRFKRESGIAFIVPDDIRMQQDFLVPPGKEAHAKEGQIVHADILTYPDTHQQPTAAIIEVLGDAQTPQMAEEMAIRSFDIPSEFAGEVIQAAEKLPDSIDGDKYPERRDLRDKPLVTIDGKTARDFDDAVLCEPRRFGGFRLYVAIADVAEYVRPDEALDTSAQNRGTSVYLPRRVVPMLPEKLSNGLCSLNPDVDRLTLVCQMSIDASGKTTRTKFFEAVIRSHARLTYSEVWDFLSGETEEAAMKKKRGAGVVKNLRGLHELYKVLLKARHKRGALEFDSVEPIFRFDDQGEVEDITIVERNDAHRLIEECMIAANVAAAKYLRRHKVPSPYRVHEPPALDRVESLAAFLQQLGLGGLIKSDRSPTPDDFARVADAIKDRSDREMIQTMLLRSMNLAVYQAENLGHFGLALDAYTHFTSPIRRYPDLLVHRAIKSTLRKKKQHPYTKPVVQQMCEHSSMAEQRAEEASRDVDERLKCNYMLRHVDDVFDGVVSGVTGFGLFVELQGLGISGLVHISTLGKDYFEFDSVRQQLEGKRSGKVFKLSDTIRVKVGRVDVDERKIDLELAGRSKPKGDQSGGGKKGGKRRRKPRS